MRVLVYICGTGRAEISNPVVRALARHGNRKACWIVHHNRKARRRQHRNYVGFCPWDFAGRTDPLWAVVLGGGIPCQGWTIESEEQALKVLNLRFVEIPPGALWQVRWTFQGEVVDLLTIGENGEVTRSCSL